MADAVVFSRLSMHVVVLGHNEFCRFVVGPNLACGVVAVELGH